MRIVVAALLYLSRFFGIGAIVVGIIIGLGEALFAQFVCVDSCPPALTIFPWYFSSALRLIMPTAALLVLAYLTFLGYCLATAQTRRALAPAVTLLLGAVVSIGVIYGYSQLFLTMMPLNDGYLIDGPAQKWTAGLGLTIAAFAWVWAGVLVYLQRPPEGRRRQPPPSATPTTAS